MIKFGFCLYHDFLLINLVNESQRPSSAMKPRKVFLLPRLELIQQICNCSKFLKQQKCKKKNSSYLKK